MNLKEQFKRIGGLRLNEADVFAADEAGTEEPKSNMAVKKFDMVLKGKPQWDKVKEIVVGLNNPLKSADFMMYLMNDLGMDEKAKSKLKLKL